jgi:hypothetical protein
MKQLNIIFSTVFFFLLIASGVVFNACIKDPCAKITCKNNGVCRDGRCKCQVGFEGPFCADKTYEKFIGTYQGTYRCNGGVPENRTAIIAPGDKPNMISIYNLLAQTTALTALVDGDKISIAEQVVNDVEFKGSGYVEGLYITLFVEEKDLATNTYKSCVLNATKFVQQ